MGVHTPSTTYQVQLSQVASANATLAASVATAQSTLATALATASASAKPNDGGAYVAAINTAYKVFDAAVASARVTNDVVAAVESQQQKAAIKLP